MAIRILVTGSRDHPSRALIQDMITDWVVEHTHYTDDVVIVHGDCPTGADHFAKELVEDWNAVGFASIAEEPHPADWDQFGKYAGPKRNKEMAALGADICLAFPYGESKGTNNCIREAEAAGIPVIITRVSV